VGAGVLWIFVYVLRKLFGGRSTNFPLEEAAQDDDLTTVP
jgi:hypothetical protein